MTKPRIGPTMRLIADTASACPGLTMAAVLRAAGLPHRGRGAYRPIYRACNAGLVIVEAVRPNLCRLFATELDQQVWHLRDELLHGDPTPERSAQILAEVGELRARQAVAYAEAQEGAGQ